MKNKLYFIIFTTICLIALIICAICDLAISKALTWSLITISAITFTWLILLPSMVFKKKIFIFSKSLYLWAFLCYNIIVIVEKNTKSNI